MKVYVIVQDGVERMVAARSKAEAAHALAIGLSTFARKGAEVGDESTVAVANSEPGAVFCRPVGAIQWSLE